MKIETLQSFLLSPGKHLEDQPQISGTLIERHEGRLFEMLREVYEKSDQECSIEIAFDSTEQQNDCRELIVSYLKEQSLEKGRQIAERLQKVTTRKSGLGLLFLFTGKVGNQVKLVISRFPADNAILAEINQEILNVEFLEKVFMKNAMAYKAVLYRGASFDSDFWDGKAIDKQINSNVITISNYWIKEFLLSDFKTTGPAGTRRLAIALRDALNKTPNLAVKEEIAAASRLAGSLSNKMTSGKDFSSKFGLSEETQEVIKKEFRNEKLYTERFSFDKEEFANVITYKSIELDNGGILTANAENFDKVFKRENVKGKDGETLFVTQGTIIDQRLKKARV